MALAPTGDIIQACPLPPTFVGTFQEGLDEYTRRLTIVSAVGRGRVIFTDTEPTDSSVVWVRGLEILLFDAGLKRFVPIDISASETLWYWMGSTTPPNSTPPTWIRTSAGATTDRPPTTAYGRVIGIYTFDGSVWRPGADIVNSGTTAQRPTNPIDLEQYYDTDISALIWFERGAFRTVSGQPGDIKTVAWPTLDEALLRNPGWQVLGNTNANIRGRVISQATADQTGSGGSTALTTSAGVPPRTVGETWGETQGLTGNASLAITLPPTIAYWFLFKE